MSEFGDRFERNIVDGGVEAHQPIAHESTEAHAPLDPELREALQKVEVAREFFEKVQQRTLCYYRYRSENVSPFNDFMVNHLTEAESSSRRALNLIQSSKDKSVRPSDTLTEYLTLYLMEDQSFAPGVQDAIRRSKDEQPELFIQGSRDKQPELSTLDQPSLLKILPRHLKNELIFAVYSLERFHKRLQVVPGYDDHKEGFRRFLDDLELFVTDQLSEEGGGKLGNETSYSLMERLCNKYDNDRFDITHNIIKEDVRRNPRKRDREEHKRVSKQQDSDYQRKASEHLEGLERSNNEILKELREAEEARDQAERREVRREIMKRHPKWWWWLP